MYGRQAIGYVTFDPATGTVAGTGITATTFGTFQGISTADPAGNRFFTLDSGVGQNSTLTTVDLNTRTATSVPVIGSSTFIEYDPGSGLIYGVQATGFVTINPATGAVTPIGLPTGSYYQGISTSDPAGRRIFALGPGNVSGQSRLTILSAATATATEVTFLGSSPFIEYDPGTGLIYARQGSAIVTIDPATGAVTPTGLTLPGGGVYQGISTADLEGRRIFLLGIASGQDSVLTTIALATGTLTQVQVTGSSAFIEFLPASVPVPATGTIALFALAFFVVVIALRML